jgi:hypothetical protein
VEIGSSKAPDEWFDARLVLKEVEVAAFPDEAADLTSAMSICEVLARHLSDWEPLFLSATFPMSRKRLRARQLAFAKEHFGVTIKD